MNEPVFRQEDHGQEKQVRAGTPFWVYLPENPTTGSLWEVAEDTSAGLERLEDRFNPPQRGLIGAGGLRRLCFRIQQPGTYRLHLRLRQSWEPVAKAVADFALTLHVQPAGNAGED